VDAYRPLGIVPVKLSHYGLGQALGFQEVEAPRISRHPDMKVVRLSALRTGHLSESYQFHRAESLRS
jgi:hypothetical protein